MKLLKFSILCIVFTLMMSCKSNKYSFLNTYPAVALPMVDSTNFKNHVEGKLLNKKQQLALGLNTVFGEELNARNAKIGVSYLPEISNKFKSVVYYFYSNDTELTSILVNYDANFKIINNQMIAYDEITDGLLKSTSMIYSDKIVLKEYVSENAAIIKFNILENGDITRE